MDYAAIRKRHAELFPSTTCDDEQENSESKGKQISNKVAVIDNKLCIRCPKCKYYLIVPIGNDWVIGVDDIVDIARKLLRRKDWVEYNKLGLNWSYCPDCKDKA